MDFSFSRQQEMLRDSVAEFAEKEIAPHAIEWENAGEMPLEFLKKLATQGYMGIFIPKEYGGLGSGHIERMIILEELSKAYMSPAFYLEDNQSGIIGLMRHGSEEQKRRYLPLYCSGELRSCTAMTEAYSGSDNSGWTTTARLEGDEWILNGRKDLISGASYADIFFITAETNVGWTNFIVPRDAPGFRVERLVNLSGLRAIPCNGLSMTDCKIPKENIKGIEGNGFKDDLDFLAVVGRQSMICALGAAQGAYKAALKFANERKLYGGKSIIDLQAINFYLAEINTEIDAARWLYYYLAWLTDNDSSQEVLNVAGAKAKYFGVDVAVRTCRTCVQILGAYGTIPEYGVIYRMRDCMELLSVGTQEICKVLIGRSISRGKLSSGEINFR